MKSNFLTILIIFFLTSFTLIQRIQANDECNDALEMLRKAFETDLQNDPLIDVLASNIITLTKDSLFYFNHQMPKELKNCGFTPYSLSLFEKTLSERYITSPEDTVSILFDYIVNIEKIPSEESENSITIFHNILFLSYPIFAQLFDKTDFLSKDFKNRDRRKGSKESTSLLRAFSNVLNEDKKSMLELTIQRNFYMTQVIMVKLLDFLIPRLPSQNALKYLNLLIFQKEVTTLSKQELEKSAYLEKFSLLLLEHIGNREIDQFKDMDPFLPLLFKHYRLADTFLTRLKKEYKNEDFK